uniref:Uncharacterized protein n=1 Tax=Arundo donax TaxID=35708 RepID=A0A0A9FGH2_ARUDO
MKKKDSRMVGQIIKITYFLLIVMQRICVVFDIFYEFLLCLHG